jgi:hypothetical protein
MLKTRKLLTLHSGRADDYAHSANPSYVKLTRGTLTILKPDRIEGATAKHIRSILLLATARPRENLLMVRTEISKQTCVTSFGVSSEEWLAARYASRSAF